MAQTPIFQRHASEIWTPDEVEALVDWMALHAADGDVIPQSGGLRKIRWAASGRGKRGGARVIYYYMSGDSTVWLLMAYTKAKFDNLPIRFLKELKHALPQTRR